MGPVTCPPVPADVLVYTHEEWRDLVSRDTDFARILRDEAVWVWP